MEGLQQAAELEVFLTKDYFYTKGNSYAYYLYTYYTNLGFFEENRG